MCPDLCSLIQRAGCAAHTPGTEALFIYMVERWVAEKCVDKQSGAYVKDPDTPIQIRLVGKSKGKEKGKQWVGIYGLGCIRKFIIMLACGVHTIFRR